MLRTVPVECLYPHNHRALGYGSALVRAQMREPLLGLARAFEHAGAAQNFEPLLTRVIHQEQGDAIVALQIADTDVLLIAMQVRKGQRALVDGVQKALWSAAKLNIGPTRLAGRSHVKAVTGCDELALIISQGIVCGTKVFDPLVLPPAAVLFLLLFHTGGKGKFGKAASHVALFFVPSVYYIGIGREPKDTQTFSPRSPRGLSWWEKCVAALHPNDPRRSHLLDDRYAIQLARTEIREGYETGDIDRILHVYASDAGDMSAGQPSFSGADARAVQRARLEQMFARFRVHSAPASIRILLFGDTAFDYGWQKLVFTPRTGGPAVTHRTRYMSLWKKEADGCWRIALWIDNRDEQPMLADAMIARIRSEPGRVDPAVLNLAAELSREALEQPLAES